ncbi:MAG: AAA family ATPase [Nitrososphaerales archaeon]
MAILIFPGKGGTGKTTLTALTIKYFSEKGDIALAMDLDPDSHLHKLLGVKVSKTVGEVVDYMHKEKKMELEPQKPIDVSNQDYFLSLIAEKVFIESENFDLLTLGKPSADIDCYCPVFMWSNYAIASIMKSYKSTYDHIVVDCDPGTEIFPRRILHKISEYSPIDHMLIVLDSSKMSLDTAKAIVEEARKSELKVKSIRGLANRVDDPEIQKELKIVAKEKYAIEIAGFIPTDSEINKMELIGKSIFDLPKSRAYEAFSKIIKGLLGP